MAIVITVAQQKGGAGKTTLVAQLAVGLVCARARVAVIDIDPQASLSAWSAARTRTLGDANTLEHVQIQGWRLRKEINRLKDDGFDVVIIDSPPHTQTDATIAIREADVVLVPVQPSPMDLWACGETLKCAAAEHVPALVVLNRVNPRAGLYEQMVDGLRAMKVPIATTTLGNRVAYASSMLRGLGVAESEPSSHTAVVEVFDLVRELKKHPVLRGTGHAGKRAA
jgi:chromosome partitioning protein